MTALNTLMSRFAGDESGSPAIEYPLIAAAIAMVIISALGIAGGGLNGLFQGMAESANDSFASASDSIN